jgi:hypothetical protein
VATFPITRSFSGTLTDYNLNAHRMLAMLAPGCDTQADYRPHAACTRTIAHRVYNAL